MQYLGLSTQEVQFHSWDELSRAMKMMIFTSNQDQKPSRMKTEDLNQGTQQYSKQQLSHEIKSQNNKKTDGNVKNVQDVAVPQTMALPEELGSWWTQLQDTTDQTLALV